jgi:hypothetical protein
MTSYASNASEIIRDTAVNSDEQRSPEITDEDDYAEKDSTYHTDIQTRIDTEARSDPQACTDSQVRTEKEEDHVANDAEKLSRETYVKDKVIYDALIYLC